MAIPPLADLVQQYFKELEQRPHKRKPNETLSTSHLNRNFIAIDKFLEYLHQMGLESAPEPTKYKVEHYRKKELQILTIQDTKELFEAIKLTYWELNFAKREPRQQLLKLTLNLCYGLGLRRSEALNIKLKDVGFDQKVIFVKQEKNYKDRYVPMSEKVAESIQEFTYQYRKLLIIKRPEYLYPYKTNQHDLNIILKICSPELQAKKPTLHTLRHSIATHLLQNGMNIENISQFLGHSGLTSTQIYTHITNEL